jgi:hypothetical protein
MEMKRRFFIGAALTLLLLQSHALSQSQSQDLPKFEVAGEFTTMERDDFQGSRTEPGFGGRFTFNLNRVFSLEAAGHYFPKDCFFCRNAGHITEGFGGLKAGKRFEKWGVFAKARPGVISYSEGTFNPFPIVGPAFPIVLERSRLTTFAMDVGGVVEFYPTKHLVTRFDAGDTIVHFGRRTFDAAVFNPGDNTFTPTRITISGTTTHNFQFITSVGWRF